MSPEEKKRRRNAAQKRWNDAHPENMKRIRDKANAKQRDSGNARSWHVKKKYSVTLGDLEAMLEAQGNCCAICRTDEPGRGWTWAVDHDHQTGRVRGLLCHSCNLALGYAKDDAETLRRMINYLEK